MRFPGLTIAGICFASLAVTVAAGINRSVADSNEGAMGDLDVSPMLGRNPEVEQIIAKEAIADALARGEIGMPEAVRRVRELYPCEPAFLKHLRSRHPEASDDELYAQNLITIVRAMYEYHRRAMAAQ